MTRAQGTDENPQAGGELATVHFLFGGAPATDEVVPETPKMKKDKPKKDKPKKAKVTVTKPDIRDLIEQFAVAIAPPPDATDPKFKGSVVEGTGVAPNTFKVYMRALNMLVAYLEREEYDTNIDAVDWIALKGFIDGMRKKDGTPVSTAYRGQVYRGLSVFFNWLVDPVMGPGLLDVSPLKKVKAPSQRPKDVPLIDEEDLEELVNVCQGTSFEDRRDMAIMRLLIDTGVRLGELADLTTVSLDKRMLRVVGKTGERHLHLERPTYLALTTYLQARRQHRAADRPELWLALKGSPDGVLTHWGIRAMVDRRAVQAGLDPAKINPHKFRHTYAHRFKRDGGQTEELVYLAGWSSPAMASRYGRSAVADRSRAVTERMAMASQINARSKRGGRRTSD